MKDSFSSTQLRSWQLRYAIAVASVAAATGIRALFESELGERVPFITYFPAVMLSAWAGGFGPSLLATALGAIASDYFFIDPEKSFGAMSTPDLLSLALFLFFGVFIASLSQSMRRNQQRAEEAAADLNDSRKRFSTTLKSIGDAVISTDKDGLISFINPVAEALTGWGRYEALGKPVDRVFKIINEHTREPVENPVAVAQREGTIVGLADHTILLARDGREVPIDDSGAPIIDGEGNIIGVVLIFRDISERKQAEEALSFAASIVESSEDAIFGKTLDGRIVSWNAGAERLYGYTFDEVEGKPVSILAPPDRPDEIPAILEGLKGGRAVDHLETRRVRKDGTTIDVSLTISPIRDRDGRITGASTIARDITERRRSERERDELLARLQEQSRRLQLLAEAGELLSNSLDYEVTLSSIARLAVPRLADWCAVHIVEPGGRIRELATAHVDPSKLEWARQIQARYPLEPDAPMGVPNVLRTGKSEYYRDVPDSVLAAAARDEEHLALMRGVGVKSVIIVPMVARGRTLGTITLVAAESGRSYEQADLALAEDVAHRAAFAVDNSRLYGDTQQARNRLAFIAEASAVLAASLDYSTTISSIAEMSVPRFADWCVIDVVEPDGRINRISSTASSPEKQKLLEEMARLYPPTWNSPQPAAVVLRSGKSLMASGLETEAMLAFVRDEGHLKLMRQLSPRCAISVPLVARAHTIGAITFVLDRDGGDYSKDDLALAEQLAHRAALAVDNARLYRESQKAIAEREEALRLRDDLLLREQAARAEAESANRSKDEFLATVSHELRTPLNAILGWAHMLRTEKLEPELEKRAVETIERNAKAQAQLIEDILDVSRIVTGKLRLDVHPIDLAPVIDQAIEAVRPAAEAKGIRLQSVLDPRAGPVSGDPNRIQQVVWNLLSNAVKFTPRDGSVHIRLERVNSHVEIIISDTGQGITPEFLPLVFDRFRQADASSTRQHGGLGLGLAIVRHLVEMHGGTVHAESPGDGRGATFVVKLPLIPVRSDGRASVRGHPRVGGASLPESPSLEGLRIMIVDDEPDTRDMLKLMIEKIGAEVKPCSTAAEAFQVFQTWEPHVLVSDIEMPDEDGYELIRRLREWESGRDRQTPAVALTAYARVEDRMRALQAGYQIHVAKPVELAELAVVIATLAKGARG